MKRYSRNAERNQVIFLLSLHGFRAKEIAELELVMVLDSNSAVAASIALQDKVSKGTSGRTIPINKALREALEAYLPVRLKQHSRYLITTERTDGFCANSIAVFFQRLYKRLGIEGASSHSGRRTFITQCARKMSQAGGSVRDIQALAGHRHLATTQRYIEQDSKAQRKLVNLIYSTVR